MKYCPNRPRDTDVNVKTSLGLIDMIPSPTTLEEESKIQRLTIITRAHTKMGLEKKQPSALTKSKRRRKNQGQ